MRLLLQSLVLPLQVNQLSCSFLALPLQLRLESQESEQNCKLCVSARLLGCTQPLAKLTLAVCTFT